MKSKTLLIYNSLILLEILEEIKNNLDFNIKVYDENIKNICDDKPISHPPTPFNV